MFFGIGGIQYLLVQWGGKLTRCTELAPEEYAFCVLIGSTTLLVGFMLKMLPEKWNDKLPKLIDEKKSNSNDRLIKFYKAQAEAKVSVRKTGVHAAVNPV